MVWYEYSVVYQVEQLKTKHSVTHSFNTPRTDICELQKFTDWRKDALSVLAHTTAGPMLLTSH